MASNEGFLTDEQREMLKVASQNAEVFSSSPKSPKSLLSENSIKVLVAGNVPTAGIAAMHVRRSHSGKFIRVKKDFNRRNMLYTDFRCHYQAFRVKFPSWHILVLLVNVHDSVLWAVS